jgi:flagellar hook-associated protein 1
MSGTFSGISTALSALYAQRRALEVTGQNIANANTDGYSRQRVDLRPVEIVPGATTYAVGDPSMNGVEVSGVTRIRDDFLESRGRAERALNGYLAGQKDVYARIEQVVGEPSDTGLQSQLSEFWGAWHDVANRPSDMAARNQLLQRATTVADTMRGIRDGLASLWGSNREALDANVAEVNQTADAVGELNYRIATATQSGLPVNELMDQRDRLTMKLSEMTGATVRPRDGGVADVMLAGAPLVYGQTVRHLEVAGATAMAGQAASPVAVQWADTHTSAAIGSGAMAATLETLGKTLPDTATQLDAVAANLASTINTQHKLGFDLTSTAGVDFFSGTDAATLAVAISDPTKVAASSSATAKYDGANATALADLAKDPASADATYRTFVVHLGVAAQTVNRRSDIQAVITKDVDASREAEAGVNLDEEMSNMLQYQRAYQAAAKVMSAVDSTLDTLINGIWR